MLDSLTIVPWYGALSMFIQLTLLAIHWSAYLYNLSWVFLNVIIFKLIRFIFPSLVQGHFMNLTKNSWFSDYSLDSVFVLSSRTVRLWDIGNEYQQRVVIKTKNQQGRKTNATACTYSRDGRYIAAACQDGSIQLWDCNRKFVSINSLIRFML